MKGKNQRSAVHKANQEAQDRIAELEAEVERLRDIENVGLLHVQALGEIERLSRRVLELDGVERERDRLRRMLEAATAKSEEAEAKLAKVQAAHDKVADLVLRLAPDNQPAISWLVSQMEQRGLTFCVNAERVNKIERETGRPVPEALRRVLAGRAV